MKTFRTADEARKAGWDTGPSEAPPHAWRWDSTVLPQKMLKAHILTHLELRLIEELEKVEWEGGADCDTCTACWRKQGAGHAPDCSLHAALKEAGVRE